MKIIFHSIIKFKKVSFISNWVKVAKSRTWRDVVTVA